MEDSTRMIEDIISHCCEFCAYEDILLLHCVYSFLTFQDNDVQRVSTYRFTEL